ncbi:MAG: polysaccharide biosynthesis tyrosine autokinase [Sedimentisphaerales bacterium]|nr:polysaccharide biosynthesis tyrosine autokinase [Sedimentisphaerales bacterium]
MNDNQARPDYEFDNQQMVQYEGGAESFQPTQPAEGGFDIVGMLKRRWLLILLILLPVSGGGLAAALHFVGKQYKTQAAIEIAPIIPAILYTDSDSERPLPNYEAFKNTQAVMISGDTVLNRVADELYDKGLRFFEGVTDYRMRLREAIANGDIVIQPQKNTNLIILEMVSPAQYYRESEKILQTIVKSYKSYSDESEQKGANDKFVNLYDEQSKLEKDLNEQREEIAKKIDEYGSSELTARQEMKFEQVASLEKEKITVSIRKMALESQIALYRNDEPNEPLSYDLLSRKNAIIQSDPVIQALISDILRYQEMVNTGQQNMVDTHPEMKRRREMLQTLQNRYDEKLKEVTAQVEANLQVEQSRAQKRKLAELENELAQITEYENKLHNNIIEQDEATISLGRLQHEINEAKEQLEITKAQYKDVTQRIGELTIEAKRPARISIEEPYSVPIEGKLKKIAAASVFAGFALSFGLAFLLEKADKRLHAPDEMVRRVGVRIIGTTTCPREIDRKLLGQQLVDDFQTIRANLSLMSGDTHKIIVVSSAGKGDGKTTFSINLATSFAHAGQRTLLIDGDLRKPDIAYKLDLPEHNRGLQDYLFGADIGKVLTSLNGDGLSILAADERNATDAADLLSQKSTIQRIRDLANHFDVVIIDTPPVLAFADALLWGKMADGIVMVSFVGRTSHPEIRQAIERINLAGVRILGTVVNNVKLHQNYRRYGYGYGYGYGYQQRPEGRRAPRKERSDYLLLSHAADKSDSENPA